MKRSGALSDKLDGMKRVDSRVFLMGSDRFYPEEAPVRKVRVDGFWMDETPVTNRQFAAFVAATGHRTVAEHAPDPTVYVGMRPEDAVPASLVFHRTAAPVRLDDHTQWWSLVAGSDWRHPTGPDSTLAGLEDHPVVHVAYPDAEAYAAWAGKTLPTEAEWELAARGGLEGSDYAWGEELEPGGEVRATYWRGLFPFANQRADGEYRTTPVRHHAANAYGLHDLIGNVWEWTRDWYADTPARAMRGGDCCAIANPRGATLRDSLDPDAPHLRIGRKVLKGGSHLCAANYCQRYRPAARHAQMIDSSTSHIGFRCIVRAR